MTVRIRLLNAGLVRELLTFEHCIPLMRHAMALVSRGQVRQPIRQVTARPDGRGALGLMPAFVEDPPWLGLKAVTVFPGNFGTELGSHQGVVVLFDAQSGSPRAILDAREITAIRTAAATAVATDVLAPKSVRTLALFGYGEQAHSHAMALTRVRQFEEIMVWGRDAQRCRAFVEKLQHQLSIPARAVAGAEEAAQADIVCTLTAAPEPFYRAAWLRKGQHLNVVGSSIPSTAEIDSEVVAGTRFFVDYKDSALALAGEFLRAKRAGLVTDDHIVGCVGDVLEGKVAGRTTESDITLFKSLGMAAEDVVSADFLLHEAERRNVGQMVEW